MDKNHLNWVKSHDWGREAKLIDGEISLFDQDKQKQISFISFSQVRKWAGY
tara:strand:- start:7 stop:159 length:153 start_codon:yes stop_codon:yes gene_type:complete